MSRPFPMGIKILTLCLFMSQVSIELLSQEIFPHLLESADHLKAPEKPVFSLALDRPWFNLGLGFGRPQERKVGNAHAYSYGTHVQSSLHWPFGPVELEGKFRYGLLLGEQYSVPENAANKRMKHESWQAEFLLGLAFDEIRPRWLFIPRIGAYYSTIHSFSQKEHRRIIRSPQLSLFWLYEQMDNDLFFLNLKYIHQDKGKLPQQKGRHTQFGHGLEIGEFLQTQAGPNFFYALEWIHFTLDDQEGHLDRKMNILLTFGVMI